MPVRSESFAPPLDLKGQWAATPAEGVGAILARVRGIEGWLEEPEARLLLATTVLALIEGEPHGVVEIGSYQGRSTVLLGSVVKAVCSEVRVSAIDPHEGEVTLPDNKSYFHAPTLAKLQANLAMAGLSEIVEVIVQRSYQVSWDKPISLLFIDGLHDYQNVARDFAHFEGWVVSGGYIVFDDYDPIAFPGVVSFVDEVLGSGRYQEVQRVGRLVVTRKWSQAASPGDFGSGPRTGVTSREMRDTAASRALAGPKGTTNLPNGLGSRASKRP